MIGFTVVTASSSSTPVSGSTAATINDAISCNGFTLAGTSIYYVNQNSAENAFTWVNFDSGTSVFSDCFTYYEILVNGTTSSTAILT